MVFTWDKYKGACRFEKYVGAFNSICQEWLYHFGNGTKVSSDIKFSVPITVACAVLYNFCIKMGDDWDDDGNPDHHCRDDDNEDVVRDGEEIRDILKEFL